jgi:nucleotide-binding universal stress UspA family protein
VDKLAAAERRRVWEPIEGHLTRAHVPIERVDIEGYPPDALVAYVKNVGASLLVVGTRGRGELASMVLGSTSHRAIHLSPCDVLVVKPQSEPPL